ncbi:hypothetical protein Pla22_33380 [Rubripirellula amarantea]|uniref:von Willebrand factor type A domain protein n=1 Tax=Rubripirellula amarantea TaxID=2527999 RepID=A0A5C5WKG1_9BACT|nr:VWA domain-containing protein [Rubripirellula amarantea]TWT50595.1 hypothetical protein Pla22_33380 [Rubripirellula amarantea]
MSERQVVYEFARAATLEGWWLWATLVGSLAALLFVCVRYYRRDVSELSRPVRAALLLLRLTTIVALVFFFFELQRRTQRLITRPSEVAVLVDTSQSMSLPSSSNLTSQSRAERAETILAQTDWLDTLKEQHRVSIYTFGGEAEPTIIESIGGSQTTDQDQTEESVPEGSSLAIFAASLIALGVILAVLSLLIGAVSKSSSSNSSSSSQPAASTLGWWILGSAVCLIIGITILGGVASVRSQQSLAEIFGGASLASTDEPDEEDLDATLPETIQVDDWSDAIAATDPQSRIGDAIRGILTDHDPATLAGIVLLSDGQANGGSDAAAAVAAARRSEVAIYTVGLGSSDAPTNVRVVDLDAPRRVYPGDRFAVTGVLQASGAKPLDVEVQLIDGLDSGTGDENDDAESGKVVDSQRVTISNDGTLSGVRFEIEPESVGRRRLSIRVVAPAEDRNQRDDQRSARYEVVSRKLRVLAIAGGPTREYRFVRNLLYRDPSIELSAWLQTGQPGMSQDADALVAEFPATAEELFEYDVIAMFDPDWSALKIEELDLLERWLAQQAGGLILVAGPVYHPQWIRKRTDPRVAKIASFFPVSLSTQSPLLSGGRQGGENAWPIKLTPESQRAEFLWIAPSPEESFEVWEDFSGVFDFVDAKSPKPGAKVYGYFSDPTTELNGSLPIYMASQFYGAGRVYFQGSGEMWRLRGVSDAYFDSYYTKLVRWVSEGRLLRDSNRGVLLVDSSRAMVGDTITVRAVLTDEQFEPLDVPEVQAKVLGPGGRIDDVMLTPLKGEPRAGTYGGRFLVREAGSYEIRLTLGDALDEQVLRQSVQVRLPTIELERPRRNDIELQQFANVTGGEYLPVNDDVTDESLTGQLSNWLRPQPQTTILPGTPDLDFNTRRNAALLWLIATVLTMEWVTRRLHRLA